jgi:hypothetical protein
MESRFGRSELTHPISSRHLRSPDRTELGEEHRGCARLSPMYPLGLWQGVSERAWNAVIMKIGMGYGCTCPLLSRKD